MALKKKLDFKKQGGFTLIELLVVISIISLLSSIGMVAFKNARTRARDAYRRSNMRQLVSALELYASSNNGVYPATFSGVTPTNGVGGGYWTEGIVQGGDPSHPLTGATGYIPNLSPQYVLKLPTEYLLTRGNPFALANTGGFCSASNIGMAYVSNGLDYKLLDFCASESIIPPNDPYFDAGIYTYSSSYLTLTVSTPGAINW